MKEKIKTLCLYHIDIDGALSAAIVGLKLAGTHEITWKSYNYGDSLSPSDFEGYQEIYAVDLSFREYPWVYEIPGLTWIDHHKTALELLPPNEKEIPGIRRVGRGACELCWNYFFPDLETPEVVKILSSYDVWDKDTFDWQRVMYIEWGAKVKYGINPTMIIPDLQCARGSMSGAVELDSELQKLGSIVLEYQTRRNRSMLRAYGVVIPDWLGKYRVLAMNTQDFGSTTFESGYDPDLHDLMMPYCIRQDGRVSCSIYTTKPDIDCSQIAKILGGGGHPGAAGFQIPLIELVEMLRTAKPYVPVIQK